MRRILAVGCCPKGAGPLAAHRGALAGERGAGADFVPARNAGSGGLWPRVAPHCGGPSSSNAWRRSLQVSRAHREGAVKPPMPYFTRSGRASSITRLIYPKELLRLPAPVRRTTGYQRSGAGPRAKRRPVIFSGVMTTKTYFTVGIHDCSGSLAAACVSTSFCRISAVP